MSPASDASHRRSTEIRKVLRLVLWLNIAVLAIKLGVWVLSGALSVLAESLHSTLDASNNVFALAIARIASREPDADHPYGHGKFETVGALALVGVLSVTVFELVQQAYLRFAGGGMASGEVGALALVLMAGSLVAGLLVSRYEASAGRRLESPLLLADAAHTRADTLATAAVLIGLVAVRFGYPVADPLTTVLVAVIIAYTGWGIIRQTVPVLVDERAVHPLRVEALAYSVDGVEGAYSIRSRGRTGEVFAELTIAVDPTLDVSTSHDIADAVETCVGEAIGAREVVVHVEPAERDAGQ
jgi:cation diffusion facilitator family transporter